MNVVCTMFEGNYHLGVAALINSLHRSSYKGAIYVGYRGELPPWATTAQKNSAFKWSNSSVLEISGDLHIFFLPLETVYHFTNYKPFFMLELWNGPAQNAESMFYFDPDIVNNCSFGFYEEWVNYGIALVHEVIWNDMPHNHPKRRKWMEVANAAGYEIRNSLSSYINAGFIGLKKSQISFLQLWQELIECSVENFSLDSRKFSQSEYDHSLFRVADQDLLNLTAMCTDEPLSEMGPEAMDFVYGGWVMAHATGSPKPWNKTYLLAMLSGKVPNNKDKLYWKNCNYPIKSYSEIFISYKLLCINIASFIGRFYKKN